MNVMKPKDPNNSLDTFIGHKALEKNFPFPSQGPGTVRFNGVNCSMPLINKALVNYYSYRYPRKVQTPKCDKCSPEFCSPLNYRRHMRVHHSKPPDRSLPEWQIPKNNVQDKSSKLDPVQSVTNRPTIEFWRPVSRRASKSSQPCCSRSSLSLVQPGNLRFDSPAEAEAILDQRWKEAIAGEHVTLVLSPNLDPTGCSEIENCLSEKLMVKERAFKASTTRPVHGRFRWKPENGAKIKYIPKQRFAT
ncbi:hypothetical protein V6N13_042095 [Hibiscus sabdariffa]|uniref:C2H2-type domain-containing protein n=1 Tax=Hibiscus sabdariffa TaxID=183260 RepID=A0ABR2DDZ9_9ROSI